MSISEIQSKDAFATHFDTLQFDAPFDQTSLDETIVPNSMRAFHEEMGALQTLPRMAISSPGKETLNPDLEVLGTLGEGGMGLVRLAKQIALHRNVAVKTLRDTTFDKASEALLKEAYITGQLEHPNVVPVYTLGRDDDGAPLIVMKRIEGQVWLDALNRQHEREELDLIQHLRVLEEVCAALRYAHSRRVVHRDIKPENVMIGSYDEVYLLDWGIAVSLDEDEEFLPRRSDAVGVAGTPSYMAPEMTLDDASEIDEATDVYLLGATLHHILTGEPRHPANSVFEAMYAATQSEPFQYGSDVPEQLAAIANRACARDKADRFESVTEFRSAVADWREHRGSIEIAQEAMRSLDALEVHLQTELTEEIELLIHDLAGECRFGFRQALKMWPENEVASAGEQRFFRRMFDFQIQTKQPIAARAILGELGGEATDDMRERVSHLESQMEAEKEKVDKLERMADDLDLRTAATSRSRLAALLGVLWTLSTSYAAWTIHHGPPMTNAELLEGNMIAAIRSLAIVATSVFIFRKRIFANLANRRLMYILFSVMGTMVIMRSCFWSLGADYGTAHVAETALYGFAVLTLGITTDLRICLLALGFFTPAVVASVYPHYQLWVLAPFNFLIFMGLAWMWSPRQMDKRVTLKQTTEVLE